MLMRFTCFFIALSTATAILWASESDELRERAKAMQREAAELAEHGHKKEATNLNREAMAMLEKAEHLERSGVDERNPMVRELKMHLEKLREEERRLEEVGRTEGGGERLDAIRHEAEVVEDKLRHMLHESHHQHDAPQHDIARRLEHMRIAIEHLHQAELHEIAEHVAERAEATERELREQHESDHHEGDVMHEIMKQLDEIRREVGRLRDEMNELRERR